MGGGGGGGGGMPTFMMSSSMSGHAWRSTAATSASRHVLQQSRAASRSRSSNGRSASNPPEGRILRDMREGLMRVLVGGQTGGLNERKDVIKSCNSKQYVKGNYFDWGFFL